MNKQDEAVLEILRSFSEELEQLALSAEQFLGHIVAVHRRMPDLMNAIRVMQSQEKGKIDGNRN